MPVRFPIGAICVGQILAQVGAFRARAIAVTDVGMVAQ